MNKALGEIAMKAENIIFVILILSVLICALFWHQLSHFDQLNISTQLSTVELNLESRLPFVSEESTLSEEKEAVSTESRQAEAARYDGRDVFKLPWREEKKTDAPATKPSQSRVKRPELYLSTICWSEAPEGDDYSPLAVINGEILGKGNKDSKSQFRVEVIKRDKVRISFNNGEFFWLTIDEDEEALD